MLVIFLSSPFYTSHVCLPTAHNPIPPQIYNNPKFWPYFKDAIGALDGSHIHNVPQCWNGHFVEIEKDFVHKTVYFVAILLSNLFMQLQDGRDQLQMHAFMKMHGHMTCTFQLASITLPMLVFRCAMNFWCLIETYVIILQNGAMQMSGGSFTLF
jgi:hypothetical protein